MEAVDDFAVPAYSARLVVSLFLSIYIAAWSLFTSAMEG
jgi:hypothetical protein